MRKSIPSVWPKSSFIVWTVTSSMFSSKVRTSRSSPMSLILWTLLPSQSRRQRMNCNGTKILAWNPGNTPYKSLVSTDQALSGRVPAKLQIRLQSMKNLTPARGLELRSAFQTRLWNCRSLKHISELNLKASPITQCSQMIKQSWDSITCNSKPVQDHIRTLLPSRLTLLRIIQHALLNSMLMEFNAAITLLIVRTRILWSLPFRVLATTISNTSTVGSTLWETERFLIF